MITAQGLDLSTAGDSRGLVLEQLLDFAHTRLEADVVWTSVVSGGEEIVEHLVSEPASSPLSSGEAVPRQYSLQQHVIRSGLLSASGDGPVPTAGFIGVPIRWGDAPATGLLGCVRSTPRAENGSADIAFLEMLATAIAQLRAGRGPTDDDERRETKDRVSSVIANDRVDMVHQPIVGLVHCDVIGAEALARFPDPPGRPDLWFADAESVGMGQALELTAIRAALATLSDLPQTAYLSVNTGPATLCSREFLTIVETSEPTRLVVELTEHAAVDDYDELAAAIAPLRTLGVRLAIDDVGAGYASFNHVLRLEPDIVKLDMSLTRDIDTDLARRNLARGLLGVAHDIGARVIAEGVETQAELDTLIDLGVDAAQGYYLARPAPLPLPHNDDLPRPTPRRIGTTNCIADPRDALAFLARKLIDQTDIERLTRPILSAVIERSGLETSYLTIRCPETGALDHRYVDNSGSIQLPEGVVIPWEDTLCKRAREAGILWTNDVPTVLPGCGPAEAFGVNTFVSIPIRRPDGSDFGTLCAASTQSRTLDDVTITEVTTLAALIADHHREAEESLR